MEAIDQKNLKGTYDDFIAQYDNVLDEKFCHDVITAFDYYQEIGSVFTDSGNDNISRFDWSIDMAHLQSFMEQGSMNKFSDVLMENLSEYTTVYSHVRSLPLYSISRKVQKTPSGGGFHSWHDETSDEFYVPRYMVWMIYLNDDFDGGETEFLYQAKRVKPKRGKLLIWPSGYTHAHRGGLVTDGTKYIVTGWFYRAPEAAR